MLHCVQCQTVYGSTAIRCPQCGSETVLATHKVPELELSQPQPNVGWGAIAYGEDLTLELHIGEYIFLVPLLSDHVLVLGRGKVTEKLSSNTHPLAIHNTLLPKTDHLTKTISPIDLTRYGALPAGVSRHHALLQRESSLLVVTDLDSTNHTWLNGKQLQPYRNRLLRYGDELQLGKLQIKVLFYR